MATHLFLHLEEAQVALPVILMHSEALGGVLQTFEMTKDMRHK